MKNPLSPINCTQLIIGIVVILLAVLVDRNTCAPAVEDEEGDGGCYYMFNHYGEGDRILTNEPCLNCTCHNSMLMCYLRVCPFTKPIGQDCTIEKKPDQCCPVITCPEVPVSLVTPGAMVSSTTTTTTLATISPSEVATLERGCEMDGKYYPDGAQVASDPSKPCELCYCIRNKTACVMQECTLNVDGCSPVFQPGVCCPVRYQCDGPLQITDSSTIAGIITTTMSTIFSSTPQPGGCYRNGEYYADGSQIPAPGEETPCEHCYCMHGEIVCAVQECGSPLENEGGNCTAVKPRSGLCCPEKYTCMGDDGDMAFDAVTSPFDGTTTRKTSSETTEEPNDFSSVTVSLESDPQQAVESSTTEIQTGDEQPMETTSIKSVISSSAQDGSEEGQQQPATTTIPGSTSRPDLESNNQHQEDEAISHDATPSSQDSTTAQESITESISSVSQSNESAATSSQSSSSVDSSTENSIGSSSTDAEGETTTLKDMSNVEDSSSSSVSQESSTPSAASSTAASESNESDSTGENETVANDGTADSVSGDEQMTTSSGISVADLAPTTVKPQSGSDDTVSSTSVPQTESSGVTNADDLTETIQTTLPTNANIVQSSTDRDTIVQVTTVRPETSADDNAVDVDEEKPSSIKEDEPEKEKEQSVTTARPENTSSAPGVTTQTITTGSPTDSEKAADDDAAVNVEQSTIVNDSVTQSPVGGEEVTSVGGDAISGEEETTSVRVPVHDDAGAGAGADTQEPLKPEVVQEASTIQASQADSISSSTPHTVASPSDVDKGQDENTVRPISGADKDESDSSAESGQIIGEEVASASPPIINNLEGVKSTTTATPAEQINEVAPADDKIFADPAATDPAEETKITASSSTSDKTEVTTETVASKPPADESSLSPDAPHESPGEQSEADNIVEDTHPSQSAVPSTTTASSISEIASDASKTTTPSDQIVNDGEDAADITTAAPVDAADVKSTPIPISSGNVEDTSTDSSSKISPAQEPGDNVDTVTTESVNVGGSSSDDTKIPATISPTSSSSSDDKNSMTTTKSVDAEGILSNEKEEMNDGPSDAVEAMTTSSPSQTGEEAAAGQQNVEGVPTGQQQHEVTTIHSIPAQSDSTENSVGSIDLIPEVPSGETTKAPAPAAIEVQTTENSNGDSISNQDETMTTTSPVKEVSEVAQEDSQHDDATTDDNKLPSTESTVVTEQSPIMHDDSEASSKEPQPIEAAVTESVLGTTAAAMNEDVKKVASEMVTESIVVTESPSHIAAEGVTSATQPADSNTPTEHSPPMNDEGIGSNNGDAGTVTEINAVTEQSSTAQSEATKIRDPDVSVTESQTVFEDDPSSDDAAASIVTTKQPIGDVDTDSNAAVTDQSPSMDGIVGDTTEAAPTQSPPSMDETSSSDNQKEPISEGITESHAVTEVISSITKESSPSSGVTDSSSAPVVTENSNVVSDDDSNVSNDGVVDVTEGTSAPGSSSPAVVDSGSAVTEGSASNVDDEAVVSETSPANIEGTPAVTTEQSPPSHDGISAVTEESVPVTDSAPQFDGVPAVTEISHTAGTSTQSAVVTEQSQSDDDTATTVVGGVTDSHAVTESHGVTGSHAVTEGIVSSTDAPPPAQHDDSSATSENSAAVTEESAAVTDQPAVTVTNDDKMNQPESVTVSESATEQSHASNAGASADEPHSPSVTDPNVDVTESSVSGDSTSSKPIVSELVTESHVVGTTTPSSTAVRETTMAVLVDGKPQESETISSQQDQATTIPSTKITEDRVTEGVTSQPGQDEEHPVADGVEDGVTATSVSSVTPSPQDEYTESNLIVNEVTSIKTVSLVKENDTEHTTESAIFPGSVGGSSSTVGPASISTSTSIDREFTPSHSAAASAAPSEAVATTSAPIHVQIVTESVDEISTTHVDKDHSHSTPSESGESAVNDENGQTTTSSVPQNNDKEQGNVDDVTPQSDDALTTKPTNQEAERSTTLAPPPSHSGSDSATTTNGDSSSVPTSRPPESPTTTESSDDEATAVNDSTETSSVSTIVRIPGEGSCFVEGITYKNGTRIPPSTPCQLACACQNSIVHCLLVHCPPAPSNFVDCKPIYRSGVCCPEYDCGTTSSPSVTVTPDSGDSISGDSLVTITPEPFSPDTTMVVKESIHDPTTTPSTGQAETDGDSEIHGDDTHGDSVSSGSSTPVPIEGGISTNVPNVDVTGENLVAGTTERVPNPTQGDNQGVSDSTSPSSTADTGSSSEGFVPIHVTESEEDSPQEGNVETSPHPITSSSQSVSSVSSSETSSRPDVVNENQPSEAPVPQEESPSFDGGADADRRNDTDVSSQAVDSSLPTTTMRVPPTTTNVPISSGTSASDSIESAESAQPIDVTSEASTTPAAGSKYPVTTTTSVTPSAAPWPYPTSTQSSVMSSGACLFDGRVYMSAQQIPRDDPCDFCFCFRGDIICLQQSCPPPIPGCYEEPIPGFCCPRYECPVGSGNITTQPPLFPPSYYHNQILNNVAQASGSPVSSGSMATGPGCEISGEYYEAGQVITSTSGPCLECRCGSTGMMECDPRECQPEPMLRKMIAAITSR